LLASAGKIRSSCFFGVGGNCVSLYIFHTLHLLHIYEYSTVFGDSMRGRHFKKWNWSWIYVWAGNFKKQDYCLQFRSCLTPARLLQLAKMSIRANTIAFELFPTASHDATSIHKHCPRYGTTMYRQLWSAKLSFFLSFFLNLPAALYLRTVLRQNVASHNVYVTKRNCY
jgi:hypothetical protein